MSSDERAALADHLWELSAAASLRRTLALVGLTRCGTPLAYSKRVSLARAAGEGMAQMRAYRKAARLVEKGA